jgi:very-short-patch-repair endonuclease
MTPAEKVLWNALRRKQLDGLKFRRQIALGPYILDFICSEKRIIVEVDGDIHDGQIDYDAWRTERLEQYGYRVLRFRNDEVLNRLDTVLARIREAAPSPAPSLETEGGE